MSKKTFRTKKAALDRGAHLRKVYNLPYDWEIYADKGDMTLLGAPDDVYVLYFRTPDSILIYEIDDMFKAVMLSSSKAIDLFRMGPSPMDAVESLREARQPRFGVWLDMDQVNAICTALSVSHTVLQKRLVGLEREYGQLLVTKAREVRAIQDHLEFAVSQETECRNRREWKK